VTTTPHGLLCPSEEEYAALALIMQHDALAVEAALEGISGSFDSFLLRPVVLAVTTGISGPASTLGENVFDTTFWSIASSNFTPAPTTAATSGIRVPLPRTGWYNFGGFGNLVATGAVTANSRRTLYASATLNSVGSTTVLSQVVWRTVDTNTGGEFLVVSGGSFYGVAGATVDLKLQWSHANAASTVQVNAGAKLWCHYAGSGVEIGSA
jgi:hypothetical protein